MLKELRLHQVIVDLNQSASSSTVFEGQQLSFFRVGTPPVLTIKTVVYAGDNYIPGSVRGAVPQEKNRHLLFKINEEFFEISMETQINFEGIDEHEFRHIVEDFCLNAAVWREKFDGNDRNDLIHVRSPR